MNIKQFRYSTDNLGYLVYGKQLAGAIDGGVADAILAFIADKGLSLKWVTNTHAHADHTTGNTALLAASGAEYLDGAALHRARIIELEDLKIDVYQTPGHTKDSVTFGFGNTLIAGDTLFNGTIGNCFSGDLKGFFNSIKMLMAFPAETVIYAGHDYVQESLAFAKSLEPDNRDIDHFLETYDPAHVRSTLQDEFKINPYLRFNDEKIVLMLKARGLQTASEYERFEAMYSIE
jgi:hydroxyacylglutathione hydrolase